MTDDELRRLAEAATPRPWAVEPDYWSPDVLGADGGVIVTTLHSDLPRREDAANAAYIAAACNAVPGLLDRLRAAEAGWQPIDTAPGQSEVLVCRAGFAGWWAIACRLLGEWRTAGAYGGDPLPIIPTHWRPLPAAPEPTP